MRRLQLSIEPASTNTCGDGTGAFCRFARVSHFGTRFSCLLFRNDPSERGPHHLREQGGWLQRWPECIDAEEKAP